MEQELKNVPDETNQLMGKLQEQLDHITQSNSLVKQMADMNLNKQDDVVQKIEELKTLVIDEYKKKMEDNKRKI